MPRNAHAAFDIAAVAGVNLFALRDRELEAVRRREPRKFLASVRIEGVRAQHHAFLPVDSMRRIPDLLDVLQRPGNAAVDAFLLPEPLLHLEADLEEFAARNGREARDEFLREIVFDAGEQLHRDAIEHVVCFRLDVLAVAAVRDLDALGQHLDLLHLRIELHEVSDLAQKARRNSIHAADRLHHHRGLIVRFAEAHDLHEPRLQQFTAVERLLEHVRASCSRGPRGPRCSSPMYLKLGSRLPRNLRYSRRRSKSSFVIGAANCSGSWTWT